MGKNMGIGIVDRKYAQDSYMGAQAHWLRYYHDGQLYVGGMPKKIQGGGFKTGQKVTVRVDLDKGEIFWDVDGVTKCKYQDDMIKNKDI